MARVWRQLSPRASVSYAVGPGWSVSGSAGLYCQLPPYTALGFKVDDALVNRSLDYMRVGVFSAGVDWRLRDRLIVSIEGFRKGYDRIPLSLADGIPLVCKGDDYGTVGAEPLVSTAEGRALRRRTDGSLANPRQNQPRRLGDALPQRVPQRPGPLRPLGLGQPLRGQPERHLRSAPLVERRSAPELVGGAPYTPYDEAKSSLVSAWGCSRAPLLQYTHVTIRSGSRPSGSSTCASTRPSISAAACLGLYVDLQNVTASRLERPDVLMSTGVIAKPRGPRRRTALSHEIHRQSERDADPDARRDRRILIPQPRKTTCLARNWSTRATPAPPTHLHLVRYTPDEVHEYTADSLPPIEPHSPGKGDDLASVQRAERDRNRAGGCCDRFGTDFCW